MTERVTALIADDEAPARQLLAEYLGRFPQIRVVAVCADGSQAVREIDARRPSLAFLDIHMPAPTGLEVLTQVRHLPRVVFTTAHPEFAVQAFEVNAVDYLLKPYDFERFATAVDKALKASRGSEVDRLVSLLHDVGRRRETPGQLFLKVSGRIVAVPVDRVRWLQAEGDYTRVHTRGGSHFVSEGLGGLEARLDAGRFMRVHRSAIVALGALRELTSDGDGGYVARLDDDTEVRVSRRYAARLRSLAG